MMRRGQGLGFVMGILIALLILFSLSFASCTILQQQADIQSRINFDQVLSYLQQCQASGQKACYCDPPVPLDGMPQEESLELRRYADGLYLDLSKDERALLHKRVSDKGLCAYYYHYPSKQWKKEPKSFYPFRAPFATSYYFYIDSTGDVCYMPFDLQEDTEPTLRSCSAQPQQAVEQSPKTGNLFTTP